MSNSKQYMEWVEFPQCTRPFEGHLDVDQVERYQKMDTSNISHTQFIDLKSTNRLSQPLNPNVVSQPLKENVVFLSTKKAIVPQVSDFGTRLPNPTVLPKPTIGILGGSGLEKEKSSKIFDEEIEPIQIDDEDDSFGIALRNDFIKPKAECTGPATEYTEGEVNFTTVDALKDFVHKVHLIKQKETGCIVNEVCDPECSQYKEDIHFVRHANLGHGSFGNVDLCYDSNTEKPFVRKIMEKKDLRTSEVVAPATFCHPNITKFFGLLLRDGPECGHHAKMELYLEYGGQSLSQIYQLGKRFSPEQIRRLCKQGLNGLAHMNRYNIIHLDVKPENLCIQEGTDGLLLKITDFGSSQLPIDRLQFVGVTPEYMAPEMCQLYLQRQKELGLNWALQDTDITGKVDVFALALVFMYMYKGYHILIKVINNGNPTYNNVDANRRRALNLNLMIQMAKDTEGDFFVQNLIPDECSIDMRGLLLSMTQHTHTNRASARQALSQIEDFESRSYSKISADKKSAQVTMKQPMLCKNMPCIADKIFNSIPDIAEDCMESETGPVKNRTIGLLRRKLQPYEKSGHHGKKSKNIGPMSQRQELQSLQKHIASKNLQMPATPVSALEQLCLDPDESHEPEVQRISGTTDRHAPLAQPSMDTSAPVVDIRGRKHASGDVYQEKTKPQASSTAVFEQMAVGSNKHVRDVSLDSKKREPVVEAQGVQIPLDVLMKFLQKKALQTSVVKEPVKELVVCPPVINLSEFVAVRNRPQTTQQNYPPCNTQVADGGGLQVQDDGKQGNLPNLPAFI